MSEPRDALLRGLSLPQKEVASKYFYDRRGSQLFEEITGLPEYYLTRAERVRLEEVARPWLARVRPRTLVELGAGSASKTRILLDAIAASDGAAATYVPVDVSGEFLSEVARTLCCEYPGLEIHPLVADLSRPIAGLDRFTSPVLFAFLGSTLGNFAEERAGRLLGGIASAMRPEDRFLLGVDLRPGPAKSRAMLEAAYNDTAGVTAEFNRNALRVLNATFGTDFDPAAFEHLAFYDPEKGRIEMHLVSTRDQEVGLPPSDRIRIAEGESIRTEVSCKYDRPSIEELFSDAGLEVAEWYVGEDDPIYALVLGRRRG